MKSLYNNLVTICDNNDSFFYKDFIKDDIIYRIFNYRLASYSDFLIKDSIECRGIMFSVDQDGNFIDIKSRPMAKFWNLNENPFTMNLNLSNIVRIMDKADGSLISTYMHKGLVYLKSKGSLESDQAIDSMKYLNKSEHSLLKLFIICINELNYTVNLEWCSPNNRIVLSYDEPHLKILNIRHNYTGQYLDLNDTTDPVISTFYNTIEKYKITEIQVDDVNEFIKQVPDMKDKIEGFVCEMDYGQFFKIKTLAYLALHHTKDSINCPRRLYEAVLEETTDDLKSLFYDDLQAIKIVEDMELYVETKLNHIVHSVEEVYAKYKHLDRKNYAIIAKKLLSNLTFPLAMNLYLNKQFSYKQWMKKKWKEFGLLDERIEIDE